MVASIYVDLVITFQDWAFDLNAVYIFAVGGHVMFTVTAIGIILLPGLTITAARLMSQRGNDHDWKQRLVQYLVMVFAYPIALLYIGVGIITRRSHMPLKYFKHMKTYDGIMESSFMFFMQLTVICNSTPIGQSAVLPFLEDAKFYQMLVGLIGSFGSFVYNMSEYHILSDNVPIAPKDIGRQLKLMGYYSIHFLFRAYTYSLFFVYWRYLACLTIPVVMAFNTWLTHRTYKTDTGSQRQPHIKFCTTVGGFCAFLSPCLALFFNQTTTTRNLNFFYKWNILFTNLLFGFVFLGLVIQINTHEQKDQTGAGTNYVRRNVVFSCKEDNLDYTQFEFSLPWGTSRINTKCFHETQFLGSKWISRVSPHDEEKYSPCGNWTGHDDLLTELDDLDHYLVSQPCRHGEKEKDRFNKIIIPIVAILWCLSTGLAFLKLRMASRGTDETYEAYEI